MDDGRRRCRAEELAGVMKAEVELRRRASKGMVVALRGAIVAFSLLSRDEVTTMVWCGVLL